LLLCAALDAPLLHNETLVSRPAADFLLSIDDVMLDASHHLLTFSVQLLTASSDALP
jgi:hypothetical protein